MKNSIALFLLLGLISCPESKPTDEEVYGNTFINIGSEDFKAPDSWVTHNLFDSAFQIKLPTFMCKTEAYPMIEGRATTIFMYNDTTELGEHHYCRIALDYINHELGDFNKAKDYISYSDQVKLMAPIALGTSSNGQERKDYSDNDFEILNGPFYDSHRLYNSGFFYAYDTYYRRKGHTEGAGPVSCHIFLLMNKTEAALMTVSFHDRDSAMFENLFKVVKTFKWTEINQ